MPMYTTVCNLCMYIDMQSTSWAYLLCKYINR